MKQFTKHICWRSISRKVEHDEPEIKIQEEKPNAKNKKKKDEVMTNDKLELIEGIVAEMPENAVKVVKKDRGLIERTESSKIILTEDNRQVLVD